MSDELAGNSEIL